MRLANRARMGTQSFERISYWGSNMLNIWVGYYISVWSPGCTTFENQDASKIGSEGRMSIPNRPIVDISGGRACVPFRQSCIVCRLFQRRLIDLAERRKIESSVFSTESHRRLTNRCGLGVRLVSMCPMLVECIVEE